jgi:hypothetical protein
MKSIPVLLENENTLVGMTINEICLKFKIVPDRISTGLDLDVPVKKVRKNDNGQLMFLIGSKLVFPSVIGFIQCACTVDDLIEIFDLQGTEAFSEFPV